MHSHEHDVDAAVSLRPKGSRLTEAEPALAAQAAAQGRWDAVGASGIAHLQRAAGNAGVTAALGEEDRSPVHDVVSSGGRALDPDTRADMEGRLGHDFGDVRVHDDSRAHDSAVGVNANAYTVGSNIVFQRDRYDPSSSEGKLTLAHELTHVVQQGGPDRLAALRRQSARTASRSAEGAGTIRRVWLATGTTDMRAALMVSLASTVQPSSSARPHATGVFPLAAGPETTR